jgi:predicted Na+-dependent transporter
MSEIIRSTKRGKESKTGRLLARGLAAVLLAIVANLFVYFLVPALFNMPLDIPIMGPGTPVQRLPIAMVVFVTILLTTGAIILLAALNRFTSHPENVFRIIAVLFLLLSFAAPFSLPVSTGIRLTLASMHILTAAIIVYVMTGRPEGE